MAFWGFRVHPLVAEWIHFTLFGITLPTIKLKVYIMNSATKILSQGFEPSSKDLPALTRRFGVEGASLKPQAVKPKANFR